MAADIHRTIEAIWRIESPKIIAGLARIVRDVGLAEDLAQDALVAALEQWPDAGVPRNPGAWLMQTAKPYHLLPSVRGDLLVKLGRFDEARAEFEHAATLTHNARERGLLLDRAAAVRRQTASNRPQ